MVSRTLVLLSLIAVYFVPPALFGYFSRDLAGVRFYAFLALGVLLFFYFFHEKFVLNFFLIRRPKVEKVRDIASNICCRLGLKSVDLYLSKSRRYGIYFLIGPLGSQKIIIGDRVEAIFDEKEIVALLFATALKLREKKERILEFFINTIFFVIFLPLFFLDKRKNSLPAIFMGSVHFIFFPILTIFDFYKGMLNSEKFDREVVEKSALPDAFSSSLFKVFQHSNTDGVIDEFLGIYTMTWEKSETIFSNVDQEKKMKSRLESLSTLKGY